VFQEELQLQRQNKYCTKNRYTIAVFCYSKQFAIIKEMFFRRLKKSILGALILCFLSVAPLVTFAALTADEEARLRAELAQIEEEARILTESLKKQQGETATISRDISVLTSQVKQAELAIQKKNIEITNLKSGIELKEQNISQLEQKIEKTRANLIDVMRRTNDADMMSLPEILLGNENLSDFFIDFDEYTILQRTLDDLIVEIQGIQAQNAEEKRQLQEKQNRELDVKAEIEKDKRTVTIKKQEKDGLLAVSKKSEANYQTVIREKQAKAASIRAALFRLRDQEGISFGDAVKYAEEASRFTGVRAAFILGILKQESNLGTNVGQCYLSDTATGAGIGKNTGTVFAKVMKPDRDVTPFLSVTKKLGLDWSQTPVSCPLSIGYGGAMGPSQFIPSTWIGYETRVAQTLGVSAANPWIPEHAFMATALFVKDLGAGAGGYSAEQQAAARYYAGGAWATLGLGYASSVLNHSAGFQEQLDFLNEVDE